MGIGKTERVNICAKFEATVMIKSEVEVRRASGAHRERWIGRWKASVPAV